MMNVKFLIFFCFSAFFFQQANLNSQPTHFNINHSKDSLQSTNPDWANGVVWYQIFPERFSNGDSSNDPEAEKVFINSDFIPAGWKVSGWTDNWFSQSEWEQKLGGNFRDHLYERRYGGDIQGIINKLDYLKDLGIGAIYLNPVFEAPSLHKYDGSTFHHIDVNFGPDPDGDRKLIQSETPDVPATWKWTSADSLFLELIEEVHKKEMRIILDGVFNHTGREFWAFKDIVKHGSHSSYKNWYNVKTFDDPATLENEFDYRGWWGIKSLPEFNKYENDLDAGPKQYIYNSTKRWMDPNGDGNPDDGIDGWRLDVAREVPLGFWKDWSNLVNGLNGKAIIIGELWELSPDFISEDGPFDALMNYEFAFAINDFFIAQEKSITVTDFVNRLEKIKRTYPETNLHLLQNLIGSHDTDRLSSMIKNPDRNFDRDASEENEKYDPGKPDSLHYEIQKLILTFQMTYQGAPMIYYGDEAGMWGADDPHCRKPMLWKELIFKDEVIDEESGFNSGFGKYEVKWNEDLFSFYKKIISIRNSNLALKKGHNNFEYLSDSYRTFVFKRSYGNQQVFVAFNLSDETQQINLPIENVSHYFELISGQIKVGEFNDGRLSLTLPEKSVRIYVFVKTE